jgi:hypothetical protein
MRLRLRPAISLAIKLALAALKVDDQTPKLLCLSGVLNRKTLAECVSPSILSAILSMQAKRRV